jgi:transcriptional regulator with XRE-family HTH domain
MTTRSKKISAESFLEDLVGPLTLQSLVDAIREGEDWTKKKMSEELGVSATYYSDFVAGNKPVSPQKAAQWADALGYDPLQFVQLALQDQLKRYNLPFKVSLLASLH